MTTDDSAGQAQQVPTWVEYIRPFVLILIGPLLYRSWHSRFHFNRELFAYWLLGSLLWGFAILRVIGYV